MKHQTQPRSGERNIGIERSNPIERVRELSPHLRSLGQTIDVVINLARAVLGKERQFLRRNVLHDFRDAAQVQADCEEGGGGAVGKEEQEIATRGGASWAATVRQAFS